MNKTAKMVRAVFLDMERANHAAIKNGGRIDVSGVRAILESGLSNPELRGPLTVALAEFIGTALDGTVINISNWTPLI